MNNLKKYLPWPPALFIALAVFIPSLFFKFSGAAESRHIFTTVGEFLGIGLFERPRSLFVDILVAGIDRLHPLIDTD